MQELPLVSIITPSYNQGRFIEETIVSVLTQDYPRIEYIVMDGGSTDETLDKLRKYESRLTWYSEKDKGQSAAINKGLRLAKGEILAYLNSDDTYLPGAITRAVQYLTVENPDEPFVYGQGYYITAEGAIIKKYNTEPFDFHHLAEDCYICQPATFWKRDVIEKIGLFDEDLHYAMDYEYWIRIAHQYGTLGYMREYLANARMYPETKTMSKQLEASGEILNLLKKHYGSGNVPPHWIYAYAHYYMERRVSGRIRPNNVFMMLGTTILSVLKSLQYNHTIPISEFKRWIQWYSNGLFHFSGS